MVRGMLPPIITRITQNPRDAVQGEGGAMRGEGPKVGPCRARGTTADGIPEKRSVLFVMTGKASQPALMNV